MTTEVGMTIPEAMAASGASWRQVHHWISKGWLHSSRGEGWAHVLSATEVEVASIMVSLIDAGMSPFAAATRSREIHGHIGEPIALNARVAITYHDGGKPGATG